MNADAPRYLDIRVLSIRLVASNNSLKAVAEVQVGPLIIHGTRVIHAPPKEPWVAMPASKAPIAGGWEKHVTIADAATLAAITEVVLRAWRMEMASEPVLGPGRWRDV